jgi:hypothetical protein
MLNLIRDAKHQSLLTEIAEYLASSRPGPIPHVLYQYPPDEAVEAAAAPDIPSEPEVTDKDLDAVAVVLRELAARLSTQQNTTYGRVRFSRFRLAYWLMNQPLDDDANVDSDVALRRRLRRRDVLRRKDTLLPEGAGDMLAEGFPWWAKALAKAIPLVWFRLKHRFGALYRWFPNQPYLAPRDPGTFIGFAERLTATLGEHAVRTADRQESPKELMALLVNAFLADVRRAFRRRWWRPLAARRVVYPVILLDRITRHNGGYRLLETVHRVRTESGAFDPLLFISGSRQVPPNALPPTASRTQVVWRARQSRLAYDQWRTQFASDSRARRPTAWYLPIQFSAAKEDVAALPRDTLEVPPPPPWSRVTVLVTAAALLLGGAGSIGYAQWRDTQQWSRQHCMLGQGDPHAKYLVTKEHPVTGIEECIGLSADPLPMVDAPDLVQAQKVIARQNREAERKHAEIPSRPYVSVVYISEISAAGDIFPTEVERLQGIAAQQLRQLDGSVADPLVRILFGNAGQEMRHGMLVADMLAQLMDEDHTIIGVVGLAVSNAPTVDTIRALGAAGVPMIAAPLTADDLPGVSPLYYQVSPQNQREAQMAARYARFRLQVTGKVTVVSADDAEDAYATSLSSGAREEFSKEGFTVQTALYTPTPGNPKSDAPTPRTVGQQLCGTSGLVFYAGRPADFAQLLDGINGSCNSSPPEIITGDDVSRYVADTKSRQRFSRIPFDYLSLALGDQTCYSGGDLNNALRTLFPAQCASTRNPSLDGHAALAYDALAGFVNAVKELAGTKITPGAVWHMINRTTGSTRIDGVSGVIDFGRDGSQVPLNKFLAVMRVNGVGTPTVEATCGYHRDRQPAAWCPDSP